MIFDLLIEEEHEKRKEHLDAIEVYNQEIRSSEPQSIRVELSKSMLKIHKEKLSAIEEEIERLQKANSRIVKQFGHKQVEAMTWDDILNKIAPLMANELGVNFENWRKRYEKRRAAALAALEAAENARGEEIVDLPVWEVVPEEIEAYNEF